MSTKIKIETIVNAPVCLVWKYWTQPSHITSWCSASEGWHTPHAENDLKVNGRFLTRMEEKAGNYGFDFSGSYTLVVHQSQISYILDDNRHVNTVFEDNGMTTHIIQEFEAEATNSVELQKNGWQAILDNFKSYAENTSKTEILHFETMIQAPPQRVYDLMIDDQHYRRWTAVFNPTSHFRGNWDEGSKILFIGCDEEGNEGGMVSKIRKNISGQYLSIEHLGELKGDVEVLADTEEQSWAGSQENYTFKKAGDGTLLQIDMVGGVTSFEDYFKETWPQALQIIKEMSEQ
jgi:uncharacterized protein YndB with AHSA1/START domain